MDKRCLDLTSVQKEEFASLHDAGFRNNVIAKVLGLSRSTICNIIKRYTARGSIENRPRTGRRKSFTKRDANQLSRLSKSDRTQTLREITRNFNQSSDRPFSQKTIQRELHKQGIKKLTVRKRLKSFRRQQEKACGVVQRKKDTEQWMSTGKE